MSSSSVSVSVNVLVEVLKSIEKKLDSQQQVLSAVIQQQQHLHHQQLLLQRHGSVQNLQVSAVHAAPSDTTATAAVTTAHPATPVAAELPDCPAQHTQQGTHTARHSPAPGSSRGQVAGSCCGDAATTPAVSLLHTCETAAAAPGSDSNPQCPAVDTASSKQQHGQPKAAGRPPNPALGQQPVQGPASPALAAQERPKAMCTDSSCAAGPAVQGPCVQQQLAGQPPTPAAAQLQLQQPQHQEVNAAAAAAAAATGIAGKLLASHCAPLLAVQQQQPSASETAHQPAPQQQGVGEQQRLLPPPVPQQQQLRVGHSVLNAGSPLLPTPELLIIPGEGSGSTGTTFYNVDDRQLLCSTPSVQEVGQAQEQQQQQTRKGYSQSAAGPAGAPRQPAAAAVTRDAAAAAAAAAAAEMASTHQGDSAAPESSGAGGLCKRLIEHSSAPQLRKHKPSAFIDQQQQMLQSCSGETAEALLSIVSCGKKGSNTTKLGHSAAAATAAQAQSQKLHAGAASPSDLMSASSTGCSLGTTKSAVLKSLYVGRPDLERFASTESINTLGSHQQQQQGILSQEPEHAAPPAVQMQHQGSFSSSGAGLDLQRSMSSPLPPSAPQVAGSPAPPKYGQHSPLQPPLHPTSGTGKRKGSARTPVQAAAAGSGGAAAAAALNVPAAGVAGSKGWQALGTGQLPHVNGGAAGLTGAASVPTPALMPQASSALMNAWSVPAPSLAAQSSGSFTGWSAAFLCAGADTAPMQQQQQQIGTSVGQQQWHQMPADAWQQQQLACSLQSMPSGSMLPGQMQHMSADAYVQTQQPSQRAAKGAGASSRKATAKVAAAHAAAKVAAAAAAAQNAGSKRKHAGSASQANKSQCKSNGTRSGQVPAQKQKAHSFTSGSTGMAKAGAKLVRSMSTYALPQPQQQQQPLSADVAAAGSLTQFPSWLLQQAYNTFMPTSRSNSTAAAAAQQKVSITGRGQSVWAAAPTATAATTVPAPGAAPAAAQAAVAPAAAAAGSMSTDSFFVDDTAAYFNDDQHTAAAATTTCNSLPTLAPTMEAAAAAAGISLPTASAALDSLETAGIGAVPGGGDGLGATMCIPTGGFMQMLQDTLF